MAFVRSLQVEMRGSDGALLGVSLIEDATCFANFERAMTAAVLALEPELRPRTASARADWIGEDGTSHFWFEGAWERREGERFAKPVLSLCSYSMMPDFGGATLWNASGACSCIVPGDALPGRSKLAKRWDAMLDSWQLVFECHVDESAEGRQTEGAPPFEWPEFGGRAACLALSSRSVLKRPVRVRAPYESAASKSSDWLPSWGESGEIELEACRMLERLDQGKFVRALGKGARQSHESEMPWAVYCAHMGLPQALRAVVEADPEAASRLCRWGSSAWSAALSRQDPMCLRALEEAKIPAPDGFGSIWPTLMAWRGPSSHEEQDALACLATLQNIAPMSESPSAPKTPGHVWTRVDGALLALWESSQIASAAIAFEGLPSVRARGAL